MSVPPLNTRLAALFAISPRPMLLAWSMVAAVIYGVPPLFGLFMLFLFLRHMRYSRRR